MPVKKTTCGLLSGRGSSTIGSESFSKTAERTSSGRAMGPRNSIQSLSGFLLPVKTCLLTGTYPHLYANDRDSGCVEAGGRLHWYCMAKAARYGFFIDRLGGFFMPVKKTTCGLLSGRGSSTIGSESFSKTAERTSSGRAMGPRNSIQSLSGFLLPVKTCLLTGTYPHPRN